MSDHLVTDVGEEILGTYTLCMLGPTPFTPTPELLAAMLRMGEAILEAEENLTDLLPDGYRVVIKEWSSE